MEWKLFSFRRMIENGQPDPYFRRERLKKTALFRADLVFYGKNFDNSNICKTT
jgi:hypothetical protein